MFGTYSVLGYPCAFIHNKAIIHGKCYQYCYYRNEELRSKAQLTSVDMQLPPSLSESKIYALIHPVRPLTQQSLINEDVGLTD